MQFLNINLIQFYCCFCKVEFHASKFISGLSIKHLNINSLFFLGGSWRLFLIAKLYKVAQLGAWRSIALPQQERLKRSQQCDAVQKWLLILSIPWNYHKTKYRLGSHIVLSQVLLNGNLPKQRLKNIWVGTTCEGIKTGFEIPRTRFIS